MFVPRSPRARARSFAVAALVAVPVLAPAPASAAEVANGSFETGDLTGWTTEAGPDPVAAVWNVYDVPPVLGDIAPPQPPCGTYASLVTQRDPVSTVLYQELELEADATHELSFEHWYLNEDGEPEEDEEALPTALPAARPTNADGQPDEPAADWLEASDPDTVTAATFFSPDTLDIGSGSNQQYRVDVLRAGADRYSVEDTEVLVEVFGTHPGDPETAGPAEVTVDLSPYAGQTVVLRFAVAVTEAPLHVMVDCVEVTSVPTPDPGGTPTTVATPPPLLTTATPIATPVALTPAFAG